jgi:nitrate reductase NapAB chaperone NapD
MVITGSGILVEPGAAKEVRKELEAFPQVTVQAESNSGTELVVNLEAEDNGRLEQLCGELKARIPRIVDIIHVYVNFEEEVEKMESRDSGSPPSSSSCSSS